MCPQLSTLVTIEYGGRIDTRIRHRRREEDHGDHERDPDRFLCSPVARRYGNPKS